MTSKPPPPNEDTFFKMRGKLIDSFARLESELVKLIVKHGRGVKNDTLTSKLKLAREILENKLSNELKQSLDRMNVLTTFRADMVHGIMATIDLDGERFACFRNARYSTEPVQPASLVTHKSLRMLTDEIDSFANSLKSY